MTPLSEFVPRSIHAGFGQRFKFALRLRGGTLSRWGEWLSLLLLAPALLPAQTGGGSVNSGEEEVFELEAFEVFSQGQVSALEDKRAADFVGSFVGGDGLEALPDDDIGDALNRLTGVNVVEGDKVSIRGLEGKLNKLTIDGESISSSNSQFGGVGEDTRNFDVGSIAVDAINRIEVIKTLTPDRDADAIGGTVNLRTASSLELTGRELRTRMELRYQENEAQTGYGLAVTYGEVLGKERNLGWILTASYREEDEVRWQAQHEQQNLPFWVRGENLSLPFLPPFEQVSTRTPLPLQFDLRELKEIEQRFNLSGSIDFKANARTQLYLKPFLNWRVRDSSRARIRVRDINASSNAVFFDNLEDRTVVYAGQPTLFDDPALTTPFKSLDAMRIDRRGRIRPDRRELQWRLLLGGETELDRGLLEYRVSYSASEAQNSERRFRFDTPSGPNRGGWRLTYDYSDLLFPRFVSAVKLADNAPPTGFTRGPLDPPQALPAAYDDAVLLSGDGEPISRFFSDEGHAATVLDHVRFQALDYDDTEVIGSLQHTHRLGGPLGIVLRTGGKWLGRERTSRVFLRQYDPILNNPAQGVTGGFETIPTELDFADHFIAPPGAFDGRYRGLGPNVSVDAVVDLFNSDPSKFVLAGNAEALRASARLYDAEESVSAAFFRLDGAWQNLEVIAGVRMEHTTTDYIWRASLIPKPSPELPDLDDVRARNHYTDWFPSLTLTYSLGANHVLRAAATTSIARPDYEELVPWNTFEVSEKWPSLAAGAVNESPEDQTIGLGSPDLEAQNAFNLDFAYDYYFGERSNFSVGYFVKNIEDFIFTDTIEVPGGAGESNPVLSVPLNGGTQSIRGVEVSLVYNEFKKWLPAPFDGLGLVLNYTFIDGEQEEPRFFFDEETNRFEIQLDPETQEPIIRKGRGLSGQPRHIANVQLSWEAGDWALRLAYNYVGELKVDSFRVDFATFQAARETIDLSLQYRINARFRFFLDGKNLTEEPFESTFRGIPQFPFSYTETGRSWVVGLRGKF